MAKYREPEYCLQCGKVLQAIHDNIPGFVGDTFKGYKPCDHVQNNPSPSIEERAKEYAEFYIQYAGIFQLDKDTIAVAMDCVEKGVLKGFSMQNADYFDVCLCWGPNGEIRLRKGNIATSSDIHYIHFKMNENGFNELKSKLPSKAGFIAGSSQSDKGSDADGWTKVEDGLPNDKTYVIVFTEYQSFHPTNVLISLYTKSYGFESASKVTHWRPLPQPPIN